MIIIAAFICGSCTFILCCISMIRDKKGFPSWPALCLSSLTTVLLLLHWTLRSISIGYPALTSLYEAFLFFSLLLFLLSAWMLWKKLPPPVIAALCGFGLFLLILCSSPLFFQEPQPPLPVLRSYWLVLHVSFSFIGETLFSLGFFSSLFYLFGKNQSKKEQWDRITYRSIRIGYLFFTAGALIFGAIWASHAWGRFWGWDPKETWALITWLTYTLYLHLRIRKGSSRRLQHWISALGFVFTLITFLGLKLVSAGADSLHSY